MANLVPLFIDKDTGKKVIKNVPLGGGGGVPTTIGYSHEQALAASLWMVPHNLDLEKFICQIYTDSGELITPDDVIRIDSNNVNVQLGTAMSGTANFVFINT